MAKRTQPVSMDAALPSTQFSMEKRQRLQRLPLNLETSHNRRSSIVSGADGGRYALYDTGGGAILAEAGSCAPVQVLLSRLWSDEKRFFMNLATPPPRSLHDELRKYHREGRSREVGLHYLCPTSTAGDGAVHTASVWTHPESSSHCVMITCTSIDLHASSHKQHHSHRNLFNTSRSMPSTMLAFFFRPNPEPLLSPLPI